MEGKESLELHPGVGREPMPGVWEVSDGIRASPSSAGMGMEGSRERNKGGFAPLSAGLVLPCLMKIRNLGRADFLLDLTPSICQTAELLQGSRSGEGLTGARLQLQLQAQSWAEMFATHSSFFFFFSFPRKQTN